MTLYDMDRSAVESCRVWVSGDKVRCLDSFIIITDPQDISLTPSLKAHGYWEAWITSWFTKNVMPGYKVVDIGANCGYFTMLFSRLVSETGEVIAFEPNPEFQSLLVKTLEENQTENVVVMPYALADSDGMITLSFPGNYKGSASTMGTFDPKWGDLVSIEVKQSTLDSFKIRPVDVIKIDAEGAEEAILNGGVDTIASTGLVVLEYTPGAYSDGFNDYLFDNWKVSRINFHGDEDPVSKEHLESLTDWDMLVLRKKV